MVYTDRGIRTNLMEFNQTEIKVGPMTRGFHLITNHIASAPHISEYLIGIAHVYIKHTSASLTINESADPTVRSDFESYFNRAVPENEPYYQHTNEGADDMPAHLKSSILGSSVTVPITQGYLNLGTWQGIFLWEHRTLGHFRNVVVNISGD